jgi:hypothetical protein
LSFNRYEFNCGETETISTLDLVKWSLEIAEGMEYLGLMKVLYYQALVSPYLNFIGHPRRLSGKERAPDGRKGRKNNRLRPCPSTLQLFGLCQKAKCEFHNKL